MTRPSLTRRRYSDEEKARAVVHLEATGNDFTAVSRQLNVPETTLRHWASGGGINDGVRALVRTVRKPLLEKMHDVVHAIVDIIPEKLPEATLPQIAQALHSVSEAISRLTGGAGQQSNTFNINMPVTEEERNRALADVLRKALHIKEQRAAQLLAQEPQDLPPQGPQEAQKPFQEAELAGFEPPAPDAVAGPFQEEVP